jgi:hypothetical protein
MNKLGPYFHLISQVGGTSTHVIAIHFINQYPGHLAVNFLFMDMGFQIGWWFKDEA